MDNAQFIENTMLLGIDIALMDGKLKSVLKFLISKIRIINSYL